MEDCMAGTVEDTFVQVKCIPLHSDEYIVFSEGKDGFVIPKDKGGLILAEAALKRSLEAIERLKQLVP
jgi:hypothetical protein